VTRLPPDPRHSPWDLVVLDKRSTTRKELAAWESFAPVLAIDEGGEARESVHYLVDILPRHPRSMGCRPNRSGLGFLDLPRTRRSPPREFRKVLVSFGGEDAAGLTLSLGRLLLAEGLVEPGNLTIVSGALRRGAPPVRLEGVTLLGPVQDLKEHLSRYDLVLTQFGITAYEAAWSGCGVVLLNPSRYHRDLARAAGFPEVGVLRPDSKLLRAYLRSPAEIVGRLAELCPPDRESLAGCLRELAPEGSRSCPTCGGADRRSLYRDPGKSYFRCGDCGTVYMVRFAAGREHPYTKSYFFEEYEKQYGRSYLEDWPNLTALAESRLAIIEELAERSLGAGRSLSLLDVGCAYGPFLAAAKARGMEGYGLDASEDAAAYVRGELGIPAIAGDFLDPASAGSFGAPFDLVSLWYVVEHFDRLDRALRNAAALVRPGGILALSTPSLEGASGRFDREGYFKQSPADHFTIWEPSRVKGILKAYGFRVERIRVTGHHPERLPGLRFLAGRESPGLLSRALLALGLEFSRLFGLGDTFEIYAVREGMAAQGEAGVRANGALAERGAPAR
jgi:SAM-dependent methyltransferase